MKTMNADAPLVEVGLIALEVASRIFLCSVRVLGICVALLIMWALSAEATVHEILILPFHIPRSASSWAAFSS